MRRSTAVHDIFSAGRLVWFRTDHATVTGGTIYPDLLATSLVKDAMLLPLTRRFAEIMVVAALHLVMSGYRD